MPQKLRPYTQRETRVPPVGANARLLAIIFLQKIVSRKKVILNDSMAFNAFFSTLF